VDNIRKLIEYAELSGFPLSTNGKTLLVKNGVNLSPRLKQLLKIYKYEIIDILEENK